MKPHKCPVCNGCGMLDTGTECFPCEGSGIVWEKPEKGFRSSAASTIPICKHGHYGPSCIFCEEEQYGYILTTNAKEGEVTYISPNESPGPPTLHSRVRFD